jgi:hypothetical protein
MRSKHSLNSNEDQMRKQRPGSFKKGHKKLGGRKKGTPNQMNRDLIQTIVRAAEQVGSDGKGKGGIDGYFQRLAGKKENQFVTLLRQAVQKQGPATEPQNEVAYLTEQDFRQSLLDRGVPPTLLPPPPRDLNEKPAVKGQLIPPKPPPGWEWVLRRTDETADVEIQEEDPVQNESEVESWERVERLEEGKNYGTAGNPAPGYRYVYDPDYRCYFVFKRKSNRRSDKQPGELERRFE